MTVSPLKLARATKKCRYQRIMVVAKSLSNKDGVIPLDSLKNSFDLHESAEMVDKLGHILHRAKKILVADSNRGQVWIDLSVKPQRT